MRAARPAVTLLLGACGLLAPGAGWAAGYELLWMANWNSPANLDDVANAVAIDRLGNVFVAGQSDRSDIGEALNIVVLKYSPEGSLLWSRSHNSFPGGMDMAFGVAVDATGNCYVAGSVSITGGASNGWLRKFDPSGGEIWTLEYASPAPGGQVVFRGVALDPASGNVYVAGCSERGDLLQSGNALLLKVGPAGGAPVWAVDADGGAGLWDEFLAVAVAGNGDPVVAGYEGVSDPAGLMSTWGKWIPVRTAAAYNYAVVNTDTDVVVCRYTPAGALLWRRTFGSENGLTGVTWDLGTGVCVSPGGAVVVAATVAATNSLPVNYDRWMRAWAGDGNSVLWTREIAGGQPPDAADTTGGCAVTPDGRVLVAGSESHSEIYQAWNVTLDQLDSGLGFLVRSDSYGSGFFLQDEGRAVAADGWGGCVLAGFERRSDLLQANNFVVRRYAGPASAVAEAGGVVGYPNPFDPSRAVGGRFKFANLPEGASVRIWTLAGLLVARLEVRETSAAWDGRTGSGAPAAPGLYHWTVEAPGSPRTTGTVVLVRP